MQGSTGPWVSGLWMDHAGSVVRCNPGFGTVSTIGGSFQSGKRRMNYVQVIERLWLRRLAQAVKAVERRN